MSMEKEALTNTIESDLAKRNRNWDKVDTHLAEKVSKVVRVVEPNESLTKTTVMLGFRAKHLIITVVIENTKYESVSYLDGESAYAKHSLVATDKMTVSSFGVILQYDANNYLQGDVSIFDDRIEIDWTLAGTLTDAGEGVRLLIVSATTHGLGAPSGEGGQTPDPPQGTPLAGKKFVSLGDSITEQNLWQLYITSYFDLAHVNCGVGSTSVAGTANATYPCFWEDSRLNGVKANNPDILTILGGANDWSRDIPIGTDDECGKQLTLKDKTNFKGAYSYIIENLLTWNPYLAIVLLTTTYGDAEADNSLSLTNRDYAEAVKDVAWYYGLTCVDLRGGMGLNSFTAPLLLSDSIHPNTEGAKRIANLVIDKFRSIELIEHEDINIYFYNLGEEKTSWSQGINEITGTSLGTCTISKETDHLFMETALTSGAGGTKNIGYSTDTKIDFSLLNTLYIDIDVELIESGANCLVGLDPVTRTDAYDYFSDLIIKLVSGNTGRKIHSIDVSGITDSRYIKLICGIYNSGSTPLVRSTAKVYRIWGER